MRYSRYTRILKLATKLHNLTILPPHARDFSRVRLHKRSKKAQKAYYAEARNTWGMVNPSARIFSSPKAYNRRKGKNELRKMRDEY